MDISLTEQTKLWHKPSLGNLELLHARHKSQSFPKHTHERYAIGVIERGALGFFYRGENVVATAGDISLCIPDEPHTGHSASDEGWMYRMFYFNTEYLKSIMSEITAKASKLPFFRAGVLRDDSLAKQLHSLHHYMELETSALAQETLLFDVLATLIKRHADEGVSRFKVGQEARAMSQVKAYLGAFYAEDITLDALAKVTGLSRYHLVRSFRQNVGVPPHAYLRQIRVERAKALLAKGNTIAEVAAMTGFSDQSHLNRWFKRLWGFTPGQYRNSVQDKLA